MNEVEEILYLCFLAVLFSFLLYPVFQEVKHDTVVKKIIKKISNIKCTEFVIARICKIF